MSQISGRLVTHNYAGFRGVDFTNKEVALYRSPDSLNMWKNYRTQGRCIETRPDIEKVDDYPYSVFGSFFYKVGNTEMLIVHSGVYLYKNTVSKLLKSDNVNKVRILKGDFTVENAMSDSTYEWRFDGNSEAWKFLIKFETVSSKKYMYIYKVHFVVVDGEFIYDNRLLGVWLNKSGNTYEFIEDTDKIPTSIKTGMSLDNYRERYVNFGHDLTPRNTPAATLPELVTKYTRTQLRSGMNPKKSVFFVYDNILYIMDGISYLQYDGTTCKEVEGYVPTTTIAMTPQGQGTPFQNVNLITPIRRNTFVADGESTEYVLDSAGEIDSTYAVKVNINDSAVTTGFTVNYSTGKVTFTTAPSKPDTDGQPNVMIEFSKTIAGYKDRLCKCTLATEFDNRIFFSGNPDYPTMLYHSELYDPTYIDDQNYYTDGFDDARIKSIVTGNNAIWVFKEPSQSNNGVYYHTPSVYADQKAYTSTNSSISTGCVSDAINFNDDIVFFSERGLEGITGDITTEQMISHRSNLIDAKLLSESNYKKPLLAEWEGYLLVFIDNHVYLADSNESYAEFARYDWFYWELPITPTSVLVKDNVLYMGTENGLYSLTDFSDSREVESYWTTSYDEFGYPQYQKTTNKRGSVLDCEGDEISLYTNIDEKGFTFVKTFTDRELYAVNKVKRKKWKGIQLKFSTTKNIKIYSCTLESYVGGYIKR